MKIICIMFIMSLFCTNVLQKTIFDECLHNDLKEEIVLTSYFREQKITESAIKTLHKTKDISLYLSLFFLPEQNLDSKKNELFWRTDEEFANFYHTIESVWHDVVYFPIPLSTTTKEATVSFVDTWNDERTYGGNRLHEGTDIMADINKNGFYPIVSMTDGIVTKKGWLEQGGYRIGISAPSGGYYYYAHLDSYANIEVGDHVSAGDFLGYMGDSGYGEKGTRGKFPVHLHLGIYFMYKGQEISVNPYWILRYIEDSKLKYAY